MNPKWKLILKEKQEKCIDEVIARLEEIDSDAVGVIAAQDIIDIVVENLGAQIYNSGIKDAKNLMQVKFNDFEIDLDILQEA